MFTKIKKYLILLQELLLPIEKEEIKIFLSMSVLMLCMLFNFASLRSLKDGLVVPSMGAEVISFLKLWLVLPFSVLFTIFYAKLSNIFSFEKVFYLVVSLFLCIFLLFTYAFYPHQNFYHPSENFIIELVTAYPYFKWFIIIISKWSYAVVYIFAELWSVVCINLMFWQFANHIFNTSQAKRCYPLLGMVGNFGLIIAGNLLVFFSNVTTEEIDISLPQYQLQCQKMLEPITLSITVAGILAMIIFYFINNYVLKTNISNDKCIAVNGNTKTRLSLLDSIKLIINSKYIGHIVLMVLCYGLTINLLEGPWKAQIKEYYPNTLEYVNFMGQFNIYLGISCIIFTFIGSNILRRLSWRTSAMITPIIIFITGTLFFYFIIINRNITIMGMIINPIFAAVIIGAIQNILSKSTKYSLFDSTKELAYIPLSLELRTKGKATAEIIGLKAGKSLGAFIQSSTFMFLPGASFASMSSYLMMIFWVFMVIWLYNVFYLNKKYIRLVNGE